MAAPVGHLRGRVAAAAVALPVLLLGCLPFSLSDVLNGEDGTALAISPESIVLPAGDQVTFTASGGVPPYTFLVVEGDGVIDPDTGAYEAPPVAGTTTVEVTDQTGATARATVTTQTSTGQATLSIAPLAVTVSINTTFTFVATGGRTPYTFTVASGGGSVGSASGAYTAPPAAGSAVVRVTDADGQTADASVTVQSGAVVLGISPSAITLAVASSVTFVAVGGAGGYSFSIPTPGSGDPDISPTEPAVYVAGSTPGTDTVRVEDADLNTATATVTVVALTSSVDYDVPSTSLPSTAVTGNALPAGTITIRNNGAAGGGATVFWKLYLSANTTMDGGDALVSSGSIAALGTGASSPQGVGGTLPFVAPGAWYLIAEVSAVDDVTVLNNLSTASPITLDPRDVDYTPDAPVNTGATTAGAALDGELTITNAGTDPGSLPVSWQVYASTDAVLDAADWLVDTGSIGALGALATSGVIAFSGSWPTTAPQTYYLIASVGAADDIDTSNDTEDDGAGIVVTGPPAADVDYIVQSVGAPDSLVAGDPFNLSFAYRNNATEDGTLGVSWAAHLSPDAVLDLGTDPVIAADVEAPLTAATTSGPVTFGSVWPEGDATWYVILRVSSGDDVAPGNNSLAGAPAATVDADIDYGVPVVNTPGVTTAGDAFSSTFTYRNYGTHAGADVVHWTAWLSTDATLSPATDTVVDTGTEGALASATTSAAVTLDGTWPATPATWYLIVSVVAADEETTDTAQDWTATTAVATTPPAVDYAVLVLDHTTGTTAGQAFAGDIDVRNVGGHAGTEAVPWRVYVSANATLEIGTDYLAYASTLPSPGLGSGVTQSDIPFTGTWPVSTTTQSWYLLATVGAGDDVAAGNNTLATGSITVDPPDVDYIVPAVSNTGGTVSGGALAGSFTIQNQGTDNGASTIAWTAYRSLNATLELGTDPVIDSGTRAFLNGGQTSAAIPIGATWPLNMSAVTYYLIVRVTSADDQDTLNDTTASVGILVSPNPPDYQPVSVSAPTGGLPSTALGASSFQIQNTTAGDGYVDIAWDVHASLDEVLDAGDTPIDSGTLGPLTGSTTSGVIAFGGTWPAFASYYYLIITVDAGDDTNPANDGWQSTALAVPLVVAENEGGGNNDGSPPITSYNAAGTLDQYGLIRVDGVMDSAGGFDSFGWTAGAGVTKIDMSASWATGFDDVDLYFWANPSTEFVSQDAAVNGEPSSGQFTITGLTPSTQYFTGVYFYLDGGGSGSTGQPYSLYLYGRP